MADIGTYYVQIVPSAKGIGGQIEKQISGEASGAGQKAGGLLSNGLISKIAKIGIGAKIGQLAIKGLKETISAGSAFEQLSGGIEKIFNDMDTSRIFNDAKEAYKSLNMSANEYLATIVDVGANFASTMGDEKGYETAKRGMQAIADYASGTGKDVNLLNQKFQMITKSTSSYQSIADQFAGLLPATSAAFLEQAQSAGFLSDKYKKLTDVPMAEYQEAVANMLQKGTEEMGLLGNTAAESEKTLSGSMAAMKSSVSNFLVALTTGENVGEAFSTMMTTVGNFLNNLGAMVGQVADSLGGLLYDGIAGGIESLTGVPMPDWTEFKEFVSGVCDDIGDWFEGAWDTVSTAASDTWDFITGVFSGEINIAEIATTAWENAQAFAETTWNTIKGFFESAAPVVKEIATTAWENAKTFAKNTWNSIKGFFEGAAPVVKEIATTAWENAKKFAKSAWDAIVALFTGDIKVAQVITDAWNSLSSTASKIWEDVKAQFKPITQTVTIVVQKAQQAAEEAAVDALTDAGIIDPEYKGVTNGLLDLAHSLLGFDSGGIFYSPSVIQVAEKGRPEFVGALDDLRYIFRTEMARAGGTGNEININVYGTEGQSVNELADIVMDRLEHSVERREAVFA